MKNNLIRDVERGAMVPVLTIKGEGCGVHAADFSGRHAYAIQ